MFDKQIYFESDKIFLANGNNIDLTIAIILYITMKGIFQIITN